MMGWSMDRFSTGDQLKDTQLSIVVTPKPEQLMDLPMGTEIVLLWIAPLGLAVEGKILVINDEFREQTQEYIDHPEGFLSPTIAIYLLPHIDVPDTVDDLIPQPKED